MPYPSLTDMLRSRDVPIKVISQTSGRISGEFEIIESEEIGTLLGNWDLATPFEHRGWVNDGQLVDSIEKATELQIQTGDIGHVETSHRGMIDLGWNIRKLKAGSQTYRVLSIRLTVVPGMDSDTLTTDASLQIRFLPIDVPYRIRACKTWHEKSAKIEVARSESSEIGLQAGLSDEEITKLKALVNYTRLSGQDFKITDEEGMNTTPFDDGRAVRSNLKASGRDERGIVGYYEIAMILSEGAEGKMIRLEVDLAIARRGFFNKIKQVFRRHTLKKTVEIFYGDES